MRRKSTQKISFMTENFQELKKKIFNSFSVFLKD
jgi:hypothetical protein